MFMEDSKDSSDPESRRELLVKVLDRSSGLKEKSQYKYAESEEYLADACNEKYFVHQSLIPNNVLFPHFRRYTGACR